MKDEITLKNKKLNLNKLLEIGFINNDNTYIYKTPIMNNKFNLIITIKDNIITSDVIEISTNEKFTLYYIIDAIGNYVGEMREEYNKIIDKIKLSLKSFTYDTSKEIINYVKKTYNDELEYLWESSPNNAIFRNKKNKKWYAAMFTVEKNKIGIEEGKIEVINVLVDPILVPKVIDYENIFPAYHMNKKSWISIRLDDVLPLDIIFKYIDDSYNISNTKK